jgi:hypothetical protein
VCFCLLGVAFFIKYRGSRVVFFANPKLMVGIMIGAALVTFSALLGTFLHTWTICVARVFTFHLGLVLVLSCVLVKLYRLHRIFANTQLKVIRLPNTLLFAGVGALVMFGCCILSIWVLAFPASSSDLADAFSRNECLISTNDVGLTVSAGVYSGLLVLLNLYFVHRLERIVPLTFRVFLNDVKESARVIGHIALLGGFCVALGIGLNSSLERRTWLLLETLASLYFSIVSVVLFVVPKWLLIREDKSLQSHAYIKTVPTLLSRPQESDAPTPAGQRPAAPACLCALRQQQCSTRLRRLPLWTLDACTRLQTSMKRRVILLQGYKRSFWKSNNGPPRRP